jgi:hypothetical protein
MAAPIVFDPYRDRMYRLCFALAAAYNVAFGVWTGLWPNHFFDLMRMQRPLYPEIWQCLGMLVGLYGAGYAYAAWRLDRGRPLIAIGLAGKLLGPLGYVLTAGTHQWPVRTLPLNIFNDVIWWVPFALYLLEGTRWGRGVRNNAPLVCAVINASAALGMAAALRGGTEAVPDVAQRVAYITENLSLWRGGWALWNAAALSLIGFYAWWGARITSFPWAVTAFLIASTGMMFDLFFESLFISWLPEDYHQIYPAGSWMMGVVANGAYSLAGAILTLRTPQLAGRWRMWAWGIWASGFALVAASWLGHVPAIMVTTALMMVLFCPFAAALRWKLA